MTPGSRTLWPSAWASRTLGATREASSSKASRNGVLRAAGPAAGSVSVVMLGCSAAAPQAR